jgi:thiol-disulfide isomerase/thioredoxin
MKRRHLLACLAPLGALPGAAQAAPALPGEAVLWPTVALLGGGRFGPEQTAGQAVVVVFWSTTCPFCKRHNPHVEKLHRAAAGRKLRVLGVAREQDAGLVQAYARAQGYSFPITLDHQAMANALSLRRVIPLTITVDRQGRLRQAVAGEMFEEDVLELLQLAG